MPEGDQSLPWGHCRFSPKASSRSCYPRRRERPENDDIIQLSTGPILICRDDSPSLDAPIMSLCRVLRQGSSDKIGVDAVLLWDESINVVMIAGGDMQNIFDFLNQASLSPPLITLDPQHDNILVPSDVFNHSKSARQFSHRHGTIRNDSQDLKVTSNFVASFSEMPSTLLSISLIRTNDLVDVVSNGAATSFLQQACLKRQLVGSHVLFAEGAVTTNFSLPFQGTQFRFQVASVLANPHSDKVSILYWIMPGTRITFIECSDTPANVTEGSPTQSDRNESQHYRNDTMPKTSSLSLSTAASLLIDTIRCIRRLHSSSVGVPRSFLLTGPPGVGKTHAVRVAISMTEMDGPIRLVSLQGSELLSTGNHPAEAAMALKRYWMEAAQFCRKDRNNIAIIFLDECEALLSTSSDVVAAMLAELLDKVSSSYCNNGWERLIVVAATNRIDAVPAWLRRPGRMDREIVLAPPNSNERRIILEHLLDQGQVNSPSSLEFGSCSSSKDTLSQQELAEIADACVGYVPADLAALVRRATMLELKDGSHGVSADSLKQAMQDVGASALRDAALSAPPMCTWDDVAGDAGGAKTALRRAVEWPRLKKDAYRSLGLVPPRGILLHGPPGCAKTTLARAAAGASGIAFFSLSPADVYASSYVGEAEAVVRRAFTLARSAAPCILFFDEIDSILGSNSSGGGSHGMQRTGRGSSAEARVLSTFLNEMDGLDASREDGVLVLGATNRPSTLDAALLRPGRFDNIIYVPPPDNEGRKSILEMQCRRWNCRASTTSTTVDSEVDVDTPYIDVDFLASESMSGSMTGAEIMGACQEAAMCVLRDALEGSLDGRSSPRMKQPYLEECMNRVKPLLSDKNVLEEYSNFESRHLATTGSVQR